MDGVMFAELAEVTYGFHGIDEMWMVRMTGVGHEEAYLFLVVSWML